MEDYITITHFGNKVRITQTIEYESTFSIDENVILITKSQAKELVKMLISELNIKEFVEQL